MNNNFQQQPPHRPVYGPMPTQPQYPTVNNAGNLNAKGKDMDMSIGVFIRGFLLCMIPIIGGFIPLAWLFGASKYQVRINYTRASFLFVIIPLAIILII